MILEVKVLYSNEWEEVYLKIQEKGFIELEDKFFVDPETDGELRYHYFNYGGDEGLSYKEFKELFDKIEGEIMDSYSPFIEFNFIKSKD